MEGKNTVGMHLKGLERRISQGRIFGRSVSQSIRGEELTLTSFDDENGFITQVAIQFKDQVLLGSEVINLGHLRIKTR